MTANDALTLLGLARKAGKTEIGEDPAGTACRSGAAKVLLLASDAADNSAHRARRFAEASGTLCVPLPCTKAELGYALGRTSCAMLALTDAGLAAALLRKLAAADPQHYAAQAEKLERAAQEEARFRKEQTARERSLQRQKQKPWAAPPKQSKTDRRKKR